MVSLLKKPQWLQPLTPKYAEESLSSEDENSTESVYSYSITQNTESAFHSSMSNIDLSYLVTQEDPQLISTSSISITKSSGNLRLSLNNYKSKSASRIQNFYRLKKLNHKFKTLIKVLKPLLVSIKKRKVLKKFLQNVKIQDKAAACIQRFWKIYLEKKENFSGLSPRRKLLSRTVTIGSKLIKIQKIIETVVLNRNFSSPSSPDSSPLIRLKGKFGHQRSLSSGFGLCRSLSDSQDTNSCTLGSVCGDKSRFGQSEVSTDSYKNFSNSSLLMKRSIRVRTKRVRPLNLEQLLMQLNQDTCSYQPLMPEKSFTSIPQLFPNCKFFLNLDPDSCKKSLECEYKELAKP